jgi:hypothetical protein
VKNLLADSSALKEPLSNIDYLKAEIKLVEHAASTDSKNEKLTNGGFTRHRQESSSAKRIKFQCPLKTCFQRVKERSAGDQLFVSDDKVRSINEVYHDVRLS